MSLYKSENLGESVKFAFDGIVYALKTQRNLRIHLTIALLTIIMAFVLSLSSLEWAIIVFCIVLMFFSEMTNTTVETLIDLYFGDNHSEIAKNAKDIAAGSVLICATGVVIVGMLIFIPKILHLTGLY